MRYLFRVASKYARTCIISEHVLRISFAGNMICRLKPRHWNQVRRSDVTLCLKKKPLLRRAAVCPPGGREKQQRCDNPGRQVRQRKGAGPSSRNLRPAPHSSCPDPAGIHPSCSALAQRIRKRRALPAPRPYRFSAPAARHKIYSARQRQVVPPFRCQLMRVTTTTPTLGSFVPSSLFLPFPSFLIHHPLLPQDTPDQNARRTPDPASIAERDDRDDNDDDRDDDASWRPGGEGRRQRRRLGPPSTATWPSRPRLHRWQAPTPFHPSL